VTTSAKLPPPLRHFQSGERVGESGADRLHILFPPDGARLELPGSNAVPAPIPLKVTGGVAPLMILVNGVPAPPQPRGVVVFQPGGPGFARVTVIDSAGATDSVLVRLDESAKTVLSR
jgi:penicillin-binding protein 1C